MDKPRRSIYPPPSVNKQEDVKPVINKALWTGVLDNLGGLLNEQKEDRKPLAAGSRFGEHPDEDSKRQMSGELAYQVKQRQKQELALRIANLDQEIYSFEDQIATFTTLVAALKEERKGLVATSNDQPVSSASTQRVYPANGGTDYRVSDYEWSAHMKKTMRDVFGIKNYRLCQEGVCNANMDSRDIICIMPTGGGKSLTYQLPALLTPGTTIVISPLLSLIADQIIHLHENDIPSVMLTGSVPKQEASAICHRLVQGPTRASGSKSRAGEEGQLAGEDGREIKLLYVTPEKVSKSKSFMSILQKMHTQGRLARFVIDEAHCVSQLGHDYRPDYNKLSVLRTYFPGVPIMAVTATCSRKVLPDLLKTLNMGKITPSDDASAKGTVFFDAPLYRKNLHYSVVTKNSNAKTALVEMADYILEHHANESGIVYCLSKKDAQTVSDGLQSASNGKIRTGVYHAEVADAEKEKLHKRWRDGKVNVVVATIAFGLGIDKGNVRFVLHHSLSKSLDGYYQETGRAGRDGEDASCVLFYRAQDATRMSSLTAGDQEAQPKLREMVAFAQDLETCRKILFGRYFSTSASLPSKSWAEKEEKCGHCDNCTRDPTTIETKDVTIQAWKICKISNWLAKEDGRITVSSLGDLARGLGGGAFSVVERGKKGKRKQLTEKATIDLDELIGGKSDLSKDAIEALIMRLLLDGYLDESYNANSYAVNVYVIPGPLNMRLARYSKDEVNSGVRLGGDPIIQVFPNKSRKKKVTSSTAAAKTTAAATCKASTSVSAKGKGKARQVVSDDEEDEPIDDQEDDEEEDDYNNFDSQFDEDEDEDEEIYAQLNNPSTSSSPPLQRAPKPKLKPRVSGASSSSRKLPESDSDGWKEFDAAAGVGDPWETVISPAVQVKKGLDVGLATTRVMGSASGSGGVGTNKRKVDRDDGGGHGGRGGGGGGAGGNGKRRAMEVVDISD